MTVKALKSMKAGITVEIPAHKKYAFPEPKNFFVFEQSDAKLQSYM